MIKYNPKQWFSLIFRFKKVDTFRILLPTLVIIGVYTTVFIYVGLELFHWEYNSTTAVHSLLGIVLGLILVFRTNTAYERWWEGRRQWGALINESRNLAMKVNAFLPEEDIKSRIFFAKAISNFVYATKSHLRGKMNINELEPTDELSVEDMLHAKHLPNKIASSIYTKLNRLFRQDKIAVQQLVLLDKEIKAFTDIVGACERIKNTPIPYSYSLFMKRFIFLYILTMPLGFITSFAYWTVPVVMFVFYVLVSIELIAEEIEEPFGVDSNDLPMEEMSLRIKQNVKEILFDKDKELLVVS
jgi:putative membrane protein